MVKGDIKFIYSLTPMQEGILYHSLVDEQSTSYIFQTRFRMSGKLDIEKVKESLSLLTEKYDILSTMFFYKKVSKPRQVVLHERKIECNVIELSKMNEQEKEVAKIQQSDIQRGFDLEKDSLLRMTILRKSEEEHVLLWSSHHIIMDGWCLSLLFRDFMQYYEALVEGKELSSMKERVREEQKGIAAYGEYIHWLEKQDKEEGLSYWESLLEDYDEAAEIPPLGQSGNTKELVGEESYTISKQLTEQLQKICGSMNVAMSTLVETVWGILLQKYNMNTDIVFGKVVSGRNANIQGIEQAVGLFNNTIPTRVKCEESTTAKDLLEQMQGQSIESMKYDYCPLEEVLSKSAMGSNLIKTLFVFENYYVDESINKCISGLKIDVESFREQTSYGISVSAFMRESLMLNIMYDSRKYAAGEIQTLLGRMELLLQQIVAKPEKKICELSVVDEEEKKLVIGAFNDTAVEYPSDKTVVELLEDQVSKTPNNIAVVYEEEEISYAELNSKANQLAYKLRELGVKPDDKVAIITQRSIEIIIGILGIIKAGGAYVPMDPGYPGERIKYMLEDCQPKAILLGEAELQIKTNIPVIDLFDSEVYTGEVENPEHVNMPNDLIYIIYTSGTTGKPKGVMIENISVVRLVKNTNYIELNQDTVILQTGAISFDASTFEIWGTVLNGGKLCLVDNSVIINAKLFKKTINAYKINTIFITTALYNQLLNFDNKIFNSLTYLLFGGEKTSEKHVRMMMDSDSRVNLSNVYGPTESTTFTTYYPINKYNLSNNIPIGRPISNTQTYIMNGNELCGIGMPGELCIAGVGLARGYLNLPELTAEKFVKNPFGKGRMYRTGDLARWLPDGNIEYLGRMDEQVKIRGFRIELGEIENVLRKQTGVRDAAVVVKERSGDKSICAYIVSDQEIQAAEIKDSLRKELPEYMVPAYFLQIENIPVTRNGKLDKRALPEPEAASGREYIAPRNKTEETLAGIFEEILGVTPVGIEDNFFEMGGHSLRATRVVNQIEAKTGARLLLKAIFTAPTVKLLAKEVEGSKSKEYIPIPQAEEKEIYSMSSAQKRLYLINQKDDEGITYNISAGLEIQGRFDFDGMKSALEQLTARHEALRTSFHSENGETVQKIAKEVRIEFEYEEWTDRKEENLLFGFVRPFDLGKAPLMRVKAVKTGGDKTILMFDMHHIISDGMSISILTKELSMLYNGEQLKPLRVQYKDYSEWMRTRDLSEQKKYWQGVFKDSVPVLDLPLDHLRPQTQSYAGSSINGMLTAKQKKAVDKLCRKTGATAYMVLLSTMMILLGKYSRQEDVVVGSPISGRTHKDTEDMMGMFVNTLAMRGYPKGDKKYLDFLKEVRESALKAYENQEYPFEELVESVEIQRDLSRNPLFDVMFVLQNNEQVNFEMKGLEMASIDSEHNIAKFDLTLNMSETEDGYEMNWEYCTDLFKQGSVERMMKHFSHLVDELTANPEGKIGELSVLDEEEKRLVIGTFNDTAAEYPSGKTVVELFEEQVSRTPDNIAVVFEEEKMTYRELNEKANQLAYKLRKLGVKPDNKVAILTQRSIEMVIGIYGIIKAGGAYVPIDPDCPEERIRYMLEDCRPKAILLGKVELPVRTNIPVIDLFDKAIYTGEIGNPEHVNTPNDLIYIIYTSGTTGRPKGVMIEHDGIVNFRQYFIYYHDISQNDIALQFASLAFDATVYEMTMSLLIGARLCLCPVDVLKDTKLFQEYITKHNVTIAILPPQYLAQVDIQHFRTIITGGSETNQELVRTNSKHMRYSNDYGPTEATVCATHWACNPGEQVPKRVPIGKPIVNKQVYIMNGSELCGIGMPGELCIAGVGLARGYLNLPELTAEKFVENPFGKGRMYRSGDLARWLPDGNIEFLGRIDEQVKIRGFRIEPGEIETQLLKHQLIKEAVVVAKGDSDGGKYLCAYYVAETELRLEELRGHLSGELPDYMVPSYFIHLDNIPLTNNGKIDKKALPEPDGNISTGIPYIAPTNEVEEKMVTIWQEILGVEKVGINDNFFELGGHSLKATLLVLKIHKEFNAEIPLREIFKLPTVKGLAAYIKSTDESIYSSIIPVGVKEYYPVSAAQKRLYILDQIEGAGKNYNMPFTMIVEGKLDTNRLEDAFRALIRRHETLRTSFEMVDGKPVQKVHTEVEFRVDYFESSKDNADEIVKVFIRPFDLSKAPFLRVGLIRIGNDRHMLMFDMHHIISDGISINILVREFPQLYNGQELAELKIQYKDFSQWQNELFRTGGIKKQEEYWLHRFEAEVPVLNMPTDYQRPPVQSFEGDRITFEAGAEISQKLNSLAKKTGTTMYMVLLAAYNALLYRYTGQEDIVVGSPIAGRPHADLQDMIGMFVNTLAMRNYPTGEKTFNEFLAEVKESCLKAYENQDYQFEELVDKLNIKRDMSRNPLFDIMFVLQNASSTDIQVKGLKFIPQTVENRTSKFDITLNASERLGKIVFEVEYCTRLFRKGTIERFSEHFINILKDIATDNNTKLSELNIITDEEKEEILSRFNNTKVDYPNNKTIHEIFEEQVKKTPDNIAVVFEKSKFTYRELNDRANSLAWVLREKGVQPDTVVGIMAERSLEMIIGIVGILKAGGAYLPIDPRYPQERIKFMLKDSGTGILVTSNHLIAKTDFDGYIVNLNDSNISAGNTLNPDKTGTSEHLAYVIYTSGSTGEPKGVMVEHRSVIRLVKNTNYIDFEENDSILQTGAVAFDATTFELWGALLNGLKLHIVDENIILDPLNLSAAIEKYNISTMWLTSPLFNQLSTQKPDIFAGLKKLLVGGDKLSPSHINTVRNVCPGLIITNGYGPTENTTFSVCFKIDKDYEQNIPIGIPINNSTAYILDKYNNLQPIGISGELCVGGDGLARGYLNSHELTEERFVTNPFMPEERMYRTGDLARWLPDGNIEFLGRIDNQVKIRGFRIEPGEIEAQLLRNPSIKEAVVLENKNENGDGSLCAYVVTQDGCHMEDIKKELRKSLPDYMIPSHFIEIKEIPLTSNGKINKNMLPKPSDSVNTEVEYIAPKTDYEKVIADIWREVLNREQIGITDNFFDIGGNSLSIIRLSSLINQKLKGEFTGQISTTTLFQYPTISSLINYLNNGQKDVEALNKSKNSTVINKDVAVIGLSGRFPGADNVNEFWENLKNGIESITYFTDDELREEGIEDDLLNNPNYIRAKGIIKDPEYFDAAFFDYSPGDAKLLDPQIRIFHECVWEALESAGYDPYSYGGSIGLFAGASNNIVWQTLVSMYVNQSNTSYLFSNNQLADKDFLTTRISYKLNLRGPSLLVQTACSTSLVAVNVAYQKLLEGECDIALAGGVSVTLPHKNGYLYQEGMIMSRDGHCRSFDAEASGAVSGEGAGVVVLKRMEDALKDGDHIWAVIKGSRINNDGAGKVGYTAPSVDGQAQVIREACHFAEVSTETISYIEAHGTATALGDPIEIEALKKAFNTTKRNYCAIGSVKTNCGHLDAAAGVTGLIKAILSLYNKQIPPNLHYKSPNPKIDFKNSPFYVNESLCDWVGKEYPLRAGVSSFGIGGTNAHVILEESPITEITQDSSGSYMLPLSAKTPGALDKLSKNFAEYMQQNPEVNLSDLTYTMQVGRAQLKYRRVVVFQDLKDAVNQLNKNYTAQIAKPYHSKVVFMFSGQGYQYVNMGRELYANEPAFREEMDNCFGILESILNFDIKNILFSEDSSSNIEDTLVAQPLNFILQYSLAKTLIKWGIKPEALIGHSLGEYVAACLAEVFTLEDALDLIVLRGRLMQQLPKGGMLSVEISETELKPLLSEEVSLAAVNSSSICVVSGSQESIDILEEKLNKMRYECMKVPATHAFHSNAMSTMLPLFLDKLERIVLKKPKIPYISNVTGTWITAQDATNPQYWAEHTTGTVRFADGMSELLRKKYTVFIEIGAGWTLNTSVKLHHDCTPDVLVVNLIRHSKQERVGQPQRRNISALFKSLPEEVSDMSFILTQLGRLWCAGIKTDWKQFYKNKKRRKLPLPTYPFQRQRYWMDKNNSADFKYIDNYKRREIGEWFFVPSWRRANLSYSNKDFHTLKNILVFINHTEFSNNLVRSLESADKKLTFVKIGTSFCQDKEIESGYFINPSKNTDYKSLFSELYNSKNIPDTILYLWTLTEDNLHEPDLNKVNTAVDIGFYGLIYIAQAIGELNIPDQIFINIVTNNMHLVSGEENINPEKAVIVGPIRTIPKEYSNIKCTGIDIEVPQEDKTKEQQIINCLLAEMAITDNDSLVAYRGKYRWIQSFDQIQLKECPGVPLRLRENGVYVITGGLGGIGLAISEYLAGTVRARLALIGRTEIPSREYWDDYINSPEVDRKLAYKIMKIKELEELGAEVLLINADVSDTYKMSKAMSAIYERFGEVNGIIHSAGSPDGGLIQLRNRETTDSVISSKIQGTLEVNRFIEHNKLDFLIYCSSLSSIIAPFGQIGYCSANNFQDAFSQYQCNKGHTYTVSINWDTWKQVGMAVDLACAHSSDNLENGILISEGIEVFKRILDSDLPDYLLAQVLISPYPIEAYLKRIWDMEREQYKIKSEENYYPKEGLNSQEITSQSEIESKLTTILKEILGYPDIGRDDNFFDLGAYSLHLIQLRQRIKAVLNVDISIVSLYANTTISSLSRYLSKRDEAQYSITDEEASDLVSKRRNKKNILLQREKRNGIHGRD